MSAEEDRGIWTQGSQLYMLATPNGIVTDAKIMKIKDVVAISPPEPSKNSIKTTTIEDKDENTKDGLGIGGEASFTVILDTKDESHQYITALVSKGSKEKFHFVLGFDDGFNIEPEIGVDGGFELPKTRTWYPFLGSIQTFNPIVAEDDVLKNQAKVKVSQRPEMVLKK